MLELVLDKMENFQEKAEIVGFKGLFLFPHFFPRLSLSGSLKLNCVVKC